MSRVIRLTPWRILTRHSRPYVEPGKWSTLGFRPGIVIVAVGLALVTGILLGATVRGAAGPSQPSATGPGVAVEAAPPTAGPIPRLARWPVEPVERPSPPTPSAAVEPGARSEPSLPARSGHSIEVSITWYCKPNVSRCTAGYPASCYCAAASPDLLALGWRGKLVNVTANGRRVTVRIVDCSCQAHRSVDLFAVAFDDLAPLSRGRIGGRAWLLT